MPVKRFNVVVPLADGGVEVHPMKEWLRRNPARIPPGMDASLNTSHQLRNGLKKMGWTVQELSDEVRLLMAGLAADTSVVDDVLGTDDVDEDDTAAAAFALEAQLRDFIAENLSRISVGGKRVSLYANESGRSGVEYPTGVGPIDILAKDDQGTLYVFELKLERGPDRALGQLARYMGWVKLNLAQGRDVRGVIVARSMDERLRYAALVMPQILLLEYEIEFKVSEVRSLETPIPPAG